MRKIIACIVSMSVVAPTLSHAEPSVQDYVTDHTVLEQRAQWCQVQMNRYFQEMRANQARGVWVFMPQPACQADAPRIIAKMAYDEARIARLQGDQRSFCDITHACGKIELPDTSEIDRTIRGYELTKRGEELPMSPNGSYHWNCGLHYPDVTTPSDTPPGMNCVAR
jgi:hypothetical protein